MLIEIDSPLYINEILKLASIVPGTPVEKLKKMILDSFSHGDTNQYKLVVDKRDEEVRGFIFATIEEFEGDDVVFVQFCVLKPCKEDKHTGFELLAKLRAWGKDRGARKMVSIVRREPKGFMRKYNFNLHGYVLTRPLYSYGREVTKGRKL